MQLWAVFSFMFKVAPGKRSQNLYLLQYAELILAGHKGCKLDARLFDHFHVVRSNIQPVFFLHSGELSCESFGHGHFHGQVKRQTKKEEIEPSLLRATQDGQSLCLRNL